MGEWVFGLQEGEKVFAQQLEMVWRFLSGHLRYRYSSWWDSSWVVDTTDLFWAILVSTTREETVGFGSIEYPG